MDLFYTRRTAGGRQLGVFVGGWTLAAAEAVCGGAAQEVATADDLPVIDGLQRLIDTSLVQQRAGVEGEPRFLLLETIREYAWEHLAASDDLEVLQRQHAAYFTTLAEAEPAETHVRGWWDRLEQEHANLRAALAWSRTEVGGETGLRLTAALAGFWRDRGHLREGYRWMVEAVTPRAAEPDSAAPTETYRALRAKALDGLGLFSTFLGDLDAATAWLEESLTLYRELGRQAEIAEVLADRGMLFQMQGDFARAGVDLHESLRLYRDLGDARSVGFRGGGGVRSSALRV